MAYLSLYRKYRSQTFEEVIGQSPIVTTLANAIAEDRVAHAYLFTGPRGTGKTSTARILAKALNCEKGPTPIPCGVCPSCVAIQEGSSLDVIEMDAASHSKVDETREILAGVALATAGGRRKVYVIDEVHMLSTPAFNALLKTLEEPPPHVVFILATTEAHKVPQTIQSRTQRFDFRPIGADALEPHLADIAKREGIEISQEALAAVARQAGGSARDALSALDQLSSVGGPISVEDAERLLGTRWEDSLIEIFEAIRSHDVGGLFWTMHNLAAKGADMRQLGMSSLEHARSLLLLLSAPDAENLLDHAPEDVARLQSQAASFAPETLVRAIELVSTAVTEMRNVPHHRLLLEMALVRAAAPETDPSATGLLGRIERLERRIGIAGEASVVAQQESGSAQELPASPQPVVTASRAAAAPAPVAPAGERPPSETPPPAPAMSVEPANAHVQPAASSGGAAPAPAAPAVPDVISLGHVKDAWAAALQEVANRSKRVSAYLNPSTPIRLDGDRLLVEVQSEFHKEAMSADANRGLLVEALDAALGIRPRIDFAARGAPVPEQSDAEDSEELADADAAAPAVADPLALLKEKLGAEVVQEIGER